MAKYFLCALLITKIKNIFKVLVADRTVYSPGEKLLSQPATNETLTDTFGRHHTYLRISLTEKCNLRCNKPFSVVYIVYECAWSYLTVSYRSVLHASRRNSPETQVKAADNRGNPHTGQSFCSRGCDENSPDGWRTNAKTGSS